MSQPVNYVIGSLYPKGSDGKPNVILSQNLRLQKSGRDGALAIRQTSSSSKPTALNTQLNITTEPIRVSEVSKFLNNWYLPQIQNTTDPKSIFSKVQSGVISSWDQQARNLSMTTLLTIGYKGPGSEQAANNDPFWNATGSTDESDPYWQAINNINNYDPKGLWSKYNGSDIVSSNFDKSALLDNLDQNNKNPDLWYPSLLYTYGAPGKGTSFPGPVLVTTPNSKLKLNFNNKISVSGLSKQQNQAATTVKVSTYGNSSSDGLGGTTSTNLHVHGLHVSPTGFSDNVVARYTSGQKWSSKLTVPSDHGIGSYWYHPHYHPSVNQQVYGGLSGFIQIGDPLSKVPDFRKAPRNLAVIKAIDINVDQDNGNLILGANANLGGVANQMTMVTVNGEFQPEVKAGKGGWQSLSLSNQANQAMYNISLIHTNTDGKKTTLPAYIYGEDGHQYPKIRQAVGTLGTNILNDDTPYYTQAQNLISLPPGKRIDLLVYLPDGKTELASTYSFKGAGEAIYKIQNMGGYPDLTSANTNPISGNASAGPIAVFHVEQGTGLPSTAELDGAIEAANAGIQVQEILPTTSQAEYNSNKVPSINLFATSGDGKDVWEPLRKREFNWAKGTLVGPAEERDGPTQELLEAYTDANGGNVYQRYTALPVGSAGVEDWLGYNQPFLINDHVFPNGNLTIAQLGTMEEWRLRNWSVTKDPTKYIGHPFHIHVNDYQVKDSDTELVNKNSLEDVTMINSSGFKYYDQKQKRVLEQKPFRGNLHTIAEALDPQTSGDLATFGANDQTVRMVFQDYLGTYVYHCHILPHEDAGMMQVITVVENTDSSLVAPAEGFQQSTDGAITLHQAQSFKPFTLKPNFTQGEKAVRLNIGDVNGDFSQDVVLASSHARNPGQVSIFDGKSLTLNQTKQLSQFSPYKHSNLAPWAFAEDFSGDGSRDLLTAGFANRQGAVVKLKDLRLTAWASPNNGQKWKQVFSFDPFDSINFNKEHGLHTHANQTTGEHTLRPSATLSAEQISVTMADMNLDNFQDVVIAYALEPHKSHAGMRIVVLDGAAISLQYQTGKFEGGYFPDRSVLADALILDPSLSALSQVVLTAGFNSYAQSPLENVVITTQSSAGAQQFTIQLNAGHFIATSENDNHGGHSSHQGHGGSSKTDDRIINLRDNAMPINLVEQLKLPQGSIAATPVLAGAFANGAVLDGDRLTIAQGNGANGNRANTNDLINTSQQLVLDLKSLQRVDHDDLTGIVNSGLNTTFSASEYQARNHLTALTYQAYADATLWPSGQAALSASVLGQGQTASQLAETLLTAPGYKQDVEAFYGGALNNLPVAQIVTKAFQALYGRRASQADIDQWQLKVDGGLSRSLVPLAILQSTRGNDQYRVGFLSATAQWNHVQWGTTANVAGSFGQGFQSEIHRYNMLDSMLNAIGPMSSWDEAQSNFDIFKENALQSMIGTPVSKSGFF